MLNSQEVVKFGFTDFGVRMSTYTVLRVENGVPLFEQHVRRLGPDASDALRHLASFALDGIYRVAWDGKQLSTWTVERSRLVDGIEIRFAVSPFVNQRGRFPKPAPPCGYDTVRVEGVSTLLTDAAGLEVFEACSAAVVAWDGEKLVLPPEDRPGVWSTAEAELAARFEHRRAPLLISEPWPWLLLNAVVGTCSVSGRGTFPEDVRVRLQQRLMAVA
jgi:hypothetical protein